MPTRRDPATRHALLIIDMVNAFDFEGGDNLLRHASAMVHRIARLKQRAKAQGVPVIYANDNHGQWRSNFPQVIAGCIEKEPRSAALITAVHPEDDDYFVLKPMQSAFQATPLERLLDRLGIGALILTGIASDGCILATAIDAHTRGYGVVVPDDCTAAETPQRQRMALALMATTFNLDVRPSRRVTARRHLR